MNGADLAVISLLLSISTILLVRYARRAPDPLTEFLDAAELWIRSDKREANGAQVDGGSDLPGVASRKIDLIH